MQNHNALLLVAIVLVAPCLSQFSDWCVPDQMTATFEGTWIASNPFFLDLVNSNGYVNGVMYHFANDTVDYTRFDINLQNGVTATLWSTWTSSVDDPNNGDTVIVSALFNGSSVMCKYFAQTQVENPNALQFCTVQSGLTYTRDILYGGQNLQRWFTPQTEKGGILSVDIAVKPDNTVVPVSHFLTISTGAVSFTHSIYDVQMTVNTSVFVVPPTLKCNQFKGKQVPSGCPFIH